MSGFRVSARAEAHIDDIYLYTLEAWGADQAESYVRGLFDSFESVANRTVQWRTIPKSMGVHGYFTRYQRHLVFWKILGDGSVGIAAVLHDAMDLGTRLSADFGD